MFMKRKTTLFQIWFSLIYYDIIWTKTENEPSDSEDVGIAEIHSFKDWNLFS